MPGEARHRRSAQSLRLTGELELATSLSITELLVGEGAPTSDLDLIKIDRRDRPS
jgi:hypothetical protein